MAYDMANNGTVIGFDILLGNRRAWILPPGATTMVDLKNYVVAGGGTVPTGMILEVPQAVSNNGSTIIGHTGYVGAWMVTQTQPTSALQTWLLPVATARPYYSRLSVENLTPGQTYYICVMNSGDWAGSTPGPFDLAISTTGGIGGP